MSKKAVVLLAAALAVLALAILPGLRHAPPTLLQRARKVATLGPWDAAQSTYVWTSGREALVFTRAGGPYSPVRARSLRADTGALTEAAALEAALRTGGADTDIPDWQLSPDRHWLLSKSNTPPWKQTWLATSTDGSRWVARPRSQSSYESYAPNRILAVWRPDSRSWIQLQRDQFSGHDDALVSIYQIQTPLVTTISEGFMPAGRTVLGFYSPARALAIYPRTGDGGGVGYVQFGASTSDAICNIYYRHVPPNLDVQEVALSPDGTRLAWKFSVKPLPLGLQSTINSDYVRHSAPSAAGLWISDLDCGGLRELGRVDIHDDHISALRWLPDGHRLSFVDGDVLYTISAD